MHVNIWELSILVVNFPGVSTFRSVGCGAITCVSDHFVELKIPHEISWVGSGLKMVVKYFMVKCSFHH